ncbi:MAG: PASTA domain-containing protein [Gaiellaceae bacterium]
MARPPDPGDETVVNPEWTPGPETRVVVEERERTAVVPPRRRLPQLWPWLLALLLLALGGVGAAFLLSGDDDESSAPTTQTTVVRIEVPALVGVREPRALELVRDAGLQAEVRRRAGNKPAGVVAAQDPESGSRIEDRGTVLLTISKGPARETVPDLVGEQLNEALSDLQGVDLASQVFSEEPSGVVVRQEPVPGTKLKPGGSVRLAVSKGPKPVPVPDVVGQQVSEATAALRKLGFEVNIVPVPSDEPGGTVVAQNPTAGTLPKPGTKVRLNVAQERSTGATTTQATTKQATTTQAATTQAATTQATTTQPPAPASVPDVVGLTQAQATKALADVGLKASLMFVPSQQDPAGAVVAQARAAGATLRRGESVQINISVGPDQVALVAVPEVVGLSEQDARSQLVSAGFRVQVLREATDDPAQSGTVVDQEPQRSPEAGLVTIYVGRSS